MKEFVLLFRMDITTPGAQPTPEQMQLYMTQWREWISHIAALGQLAEGGNHLHPQGKVIYPNHKITDGPYTADRQSVAGYIIIKALDMDDAISLAQQCPILMGQGNSVEVRETANT